LVAFVQRTLSVTAPWKARDQIKFKRFVSAWEGAIIQTNCEDKPKW
jgi:hypothetical protein